MSTATTADRGGRAGSSDPLGSIGWTERTGGVLTARECVTLARPLLREELGILAGLLAMALRVHSGRRATIEPARLAPPDSSLARDAQEAAEDLLTPALRNHSHRAYAWAAAIAARRGISFDRELLYLAAMFHDTGLPSPVPHVDFTVRSAALAREFADRHGVPADSREVVTNAIAMHHSPGVGLESGPEAPISCPRARQLTSSARAATRSRTRSAGAWSSSSRGWASSANSPRCGARRPSRSLAAGRGTCTASPSPT
jgi:hypothetical protein